MHIYWLCFLELLNAVGTIQMKPIVRNGITFLDIEKLSWTFKPTHMRIKLNNLFNGDKALGMLLYP